MALSALCGFGALLHIACGSAQDMCTVRHVHFPLHQPPAFEPPTLPAGLCDAGAYSAAWRLVERVHAAGFWLPLGLYHALIHQAGKVCGCCGSSSSSNSKSSSSSS